MRGSERVADRGPWTANAFTLTLSDSGGGVSGLRSTLEASEA